MRVKVLTAAALAMIASAVQAQVLNSMDESGNITQRGSDVFAKHSDSTHTSKVVPQGIYVWTVDRRFGDRTKAEVDTISHLYQNNAFATGLYGEYNTTGNNFTARLNRIATDREEWEQFVFTQPYDFVMKRPWQWHFTNTLSPLTNLTYESCGDKTNGEDHLNATFATNYGKRIGVGFNLDYSYARGYYDKQSASHFGANIFGSYIGDKYQAHLLFQNYHQKVAENGGILNDNYITHPEMESDSYTEKEIETALTSNWNRNDNQHVFFSHRYNIGFYRQVKMTEEEMKARDFAEKAAKMAEKDKKKDKDKKNGQQEAPSGRPDNAKIMGDEPAKNATTDTTRIAVDKAKSDSLLRAQEIADSIARTMKREFVPVTSIIHTMELGNYRRKYTAYALPTNYFANKYFSYGEGCMGDSINDQTRHFSMRNTVALALLEGFNKWAKAGIKIFAAHEMRRFKMADTLSTDTAHMSTWNEHTASIGGQLSKRLGRAWHYNLTAETWLLGEDAGQLKVDFSTDLNFPLLGDTVQLAAKAFLHHLNPTFYFRHFHSKHVWWDNSLDKEIRSRIEGTFTFRKTNTKLRVAFDDLKNYTYFGMSYDATTTSRSNMTVKARQESGNITLMTAQLSQMLSLGMVNWENVITWQQSSNKDVLPVPTLNIFTNLFLKFKIVKLLTVEMGAEASYFTKYYAPDFAPIINQYAVQENSESRVELGNFPIVNAYVNMHLKRTRFYIMMSNALASNWSRNYFLAPHYPQNGSVIRFGVSWNFVN